MPSLLRRQQTRPRKPSALLLLLSALLTVLLSGSEKIHAQPNLPELAPFTEPALAMETPRRVLLLNSYHPGMRFSDDEVQGIRENLPPGTEIFIEYMDTKRAQGAAYISLLSQLYAMKYSNARFDAILSLDDDALRFLLQYGAQIFPHTPVVFCGVNALKPGMLDNYPLITGVLETIDIETSIDFALRMLPATKRIAVITDPTTTGAANRHTLEQLSRSGRFSQPFVFLDHDGTGLELSQLLEALQKLPPDSIIYHADFYVDKQGNTINSETLMPMLAQTAPGPIFVHNAMYLGLGALGGKLKSGFDQGVTAAQLTQRIWNGTAPAAIPLVTLNGNRVMIDDQQRLRWNIPYKTVIKAAGVPQEEILYCNKPEDFWRGRGKYVFAGLAFITLEGVLIAWLVRLALRQSRLRRDTRLAMERFRALFDLAPFACVVNDQHGRYLMVNQAFTLITGITAEQALGHTSQETGIFLEKEAVRTIKRELTAKGLVSGLEITVALRPDKILYALQASALIDWDGSPVILSATADITPIRQAELALRQSEERYRELVQSANIIILKFNTDALFTFANDFALDFFGFTEEGLIGKPLIGTIVPEVDSRGQDLRQLVADACQGTEIMFENINENITRTGEVRWVHWKNRVIRDNDGRITEIFSFGSDITKRKQAEEEREKLRAELLQAQKMESVGRLAGGVAHDFNNMLGVIIGHAEMVLNGLEANHPFTHNLEQILAAANRSADLTKQLLAFARKQPIVPKVLDLNQTISVLLTMIRRLIGENIELIWQPGDALWAVCLDPTQVNQILANLCINAKDAILENGKIVIATANVTLDDQACSCHLGCLPGQYVQLTVCDNGCGMDQTTRERAFEPFFTTKELGQGTGLGLAMISGIMSQNNGFIHLNSEPGIGTTFRLYLPRHQGDVAEELPLEPTVSYHGSGTILLVEDEQVLLEMTTSMLETLGYSVKSAASAEAAMRVAEQCQGDIDLLITDVIMPGMNGRELARQLRQLRPHLPCLFISGYTADLKTDQEGYFLEKPFTRMSLDAKVREILATRSS